MWPMSWARRSRAWRWPARRWACRWCRATSRSITSTWDTRSTPPRWWVWWVCSTTPRWRSGAGFRNEGDAVYLAGGGAAAVDGSEYQKLVLGTVEGRIPEPDLENERKLHELLAAAAEARLLSSAHDVSDGGLAVCLAESAIAGGDRRHRRGGRAVLGGRRPGRDLARSRARRGGNRAGRRASDSAAGYGRWRPDQRRSGSY